MALPRNTVVRTFHRRNLTYLPAGTTYVIRTSRSRNPGAFSRVATPTWWVSERKVEWQWDYELHATNRTEEVDTQRRGFTSRVGREQVKEKEEPAEIDWITMRRKQQPKDQGPIIKVDERGFEAPAPTPEETDQMEGVFAMSPPMKEGLTKEGVSAVDNVSEMGDIFAMPPPPAKENETKEEVSKADNVTKMGDVFVMPPPQGYISPKGKDLPVDAAKMGDLFQMPPPEHDEVIPPTARKLEVLESQQPDNHEILFASDPSPDLGMPRNDQIPTKPWCQNGGIAAASKKTQQDEVPSFITANDIHENVDADIDTLLPRDIRRRMPTSNPDPAASTQLEDNDNSWHDSFGTPETPHSTERYATISIPPLTFTATPSTPISLLQSHISSFLALAPAVSADSSTAHDEDWNGFDPTPAASVENVFVFLLPAHSTPYFALASLPSSIPIPLNELKPTEVLDFLNRAGTFLPYLRTGRAEGGKLVHASREGVAWEVSGHQAGMNIIAALEAVAARGNNGMVEDTLEGVEESEKLEAITGAREEKNRAETTAAPMAKRKRSSVGRRMFWAGVWVGGLTGMIGFFGHA